MSGFVNHKLVEGTADDNHIYDKSQYRACDFEVTEEGVFLNLKCYNTHEKKKHRNVKICLTDFIFQIWKKLSSDQRKIVKAQIDGITAD